ncbi:MULTISPECIES: hypothetical protein [Eubacteriales]|jgi:hypothetical protein|uniref:hypothetical protein n=1 Tax=Eubacteriales TaxID=186802 RepID=UPI0022401EA2|nr:hypothetical protein [Acetivibrio straminisolvens]
MNKVTNLNKKRVCDLSKDKRVAEIRKGNCLTRIKANPDGTLNITHISVENKVS